MSNSDVRDLLERVKKYENQFMQMYHDYATSGNYQGDDPGEFTGQIVNAGKWAIEIRSLWNEETFLEIYNRWKERKHNLE